MGSRIPRPPQYLQRLGLEHLLDQGEHIAFLVVEMSAAGVQGRFQPGTRFREIVDGSDFFQQPVDFLVVVIEPVMLGVVFQDMIQRDVREIVFLCAVVVQQAGQDPAQHGDFRPGLEVGQHPFNLVENRQEHPMLRHQALQDRHVGESNARQRKVKRCFPVLFRDESHPRSPGRPARVACLTNREPGVAPAGGLLRVRHASSKTLLCDP